MSFTIVSVSWIDLKSFVPTWTITRLVACLSIHLKKVLASSVVDTLKSFSATFPSDDFHPSILLTNESPTNGCRSSLMSTFIFISFMFGKH